MGRKCKVVEGDLERIIERAEEFEGKARDLETQVREQEGKVKETEAITIKNAEEDKYETKIGRLQEEIKLADTRAEFAERSVDKLESTIDGLLESLMDEKLNYRNISEKLDKTLNDMMSMQYLPKWHLLRNNNYRYYVMKKCLAKETHIYICLNSFFNIRYTLYRP